MNKLQKPFLPYVTKEQILMFDKDKPETYTASPLLNAVLEAFDVLGTHRLRGFAEYFALPPETLRHGLRVATGMTLTELRDFIIDSRIEALREEHPEWSAPQLCAALGYKSRTSAWQRENAERRNRERREEEALLRLRYPIER